MLDTLLVHLQARADAGGVQACALITCEKCKRLDLRSQPLDLADAQMVAYAEALSRHTSDVCQAPGQPIQEDWHRTRCETHRGT